MNSNPQHPQSPPTIEEGLNSLLHEAKARAGRCYGECETYVRQSPGKAMLIAFGAGYLAHRLPLRSLLITQTRMVAALTPPALVAFGAAKLCELLQREARK
jgi:hypothetical protein